MITILHLRIVMLKIVIDKMIIFLIYHSFMSHLIILYKYLIKKVLDYFT